jgi:hypothetical protein
VGGFTAALSAPSIASADAVYNAYSACGTSGTFTSTGPWSAQCSYAYTGASDTFTVPPSSFPTQVQFNLIGAGQPDGDFFGGTGIGGQTLGALTVPGVTTSSTPVVYQVNVGGLPVPTTPTGATIFQYNYNGGFNGGGNSSEAACAGAGATDVRQAPYGLVNRILVAGGGGGMYNDNGPSGRNVETYASGAGGGTAGNAGVNGSQGNGGSGGNQQGGGASPGNVTHSAGFGFGGDGGPSLGSGGCGGGGGWYGGGASGGTSAGGIGDGGGGSGYVLPGITDPGSTDPTAPGITFISPTNGCSQTQCGNGNGSLIVTFSTDPTYNTTTTGTSSPNPSAQGGAVTITATVTTSDSSQPIGGGSVTFIDNSTLATLATIPVTTTGNVATASYTTSTLEAGTDPISVAYSGYNGGDYGDSTSGVVVEQVVLEPQTIAITSPKPTAAAVGSTYTVVATATSDLPVTFSIDPTTSSTCSVSGSMVTFTSTGPCLIDANQVGNSVYGPAPEAQQLVNVGGAAPSAISIESLNPLTGGSGGFTSAVGQAFELEANISLAPNSGLGAGLPTPTGTVSFTDNTVNGQACPNVPVFTNNGAVFTDCDMTESAPGSYSITVSYSGDSTYSPSSKTVTVVVTQAAPTVTLAPAGQTYGSALGSAQLDATANDATTAAPISGTFAYSAVGTGTTTFTQAPVSAATVFPAGTYALTATFTPNASGYSSGSSATAALTVSPAPLTITASDGSMTYGGTPPTIAASYSGFVNDDGAASLTTAPSCSSNGTSSSLAGSYPSTTTCSGAADSNYTISYANGTLSVGQATLTVTPAAASMVYGSSDPGFTFSTSGFVNHDTASVLVTQPSCSVASPHTNAGGYTIACAGGAAANYTFDYRTATLVVSKVPLTVTANNVTRAYGQVNPALTATISGFVLGQTLSTSGVSGVASCTTTATVSAAPGTTDPITCAQGTLTATNYALTTFVPGTLAITKASTTLVAANAKLGFLTIKFSATLSANGAPLAGQTVSFSLPRGTVCTAKTNAQGVASCTIWGLVLGHPAYTATYAATTDYTGSSATAKL